MTYIVVFRNTAHRGSRMGAITWTDYDTEENFKNQFIGDQKKCYEVLGENVSAATAVKLVKNRRRRRSTRQVQP